MSSGLRTATLLVVKPTGTAKEVHKMAVTMFIRHRVADFGTWHRVYQEVEPMQKSGGVIAESVYQATSDPNDVTVTHDFDTERQAERFAASPDLKTAMERAGVIEQPTIWITARS